jgi:hypothetical protein
MDDLTLPMTGAQPDPKLLADFQPVSIDPQPQPPQEPQNEYYEQTYAEIDEQYIGTNDEYQLNEQYLGTNEYYIGTEQHTENFEGANEFDPSQFDPNQYYDPNGQYYDQNGQYYTENGQQYDPNEYNNTEGQYCPNPYGEQYNFHGEQYNGEQYNGEKYSTETEAGAGPYSQNQYGQYNEQMVSKLAILDSKIFSFHLIFFQLFFGSFKF